MRSVGMRSAWPWLAALVLFGFLLAPAARAQPVEEKTDARPTVTTPTTTEAEAEGGEPGDPFSTILLMLALVVILAMAGRWLALRFGQPSVLGELVMGVVLGNVGTALGVPFFLLIMQLSNVLPIFAQVWSTGETVAQAAEAVYTPAELASGAVGGQVIEIMRSPNGSEYVLMGIALYLFSNLGVILLLFAVGLESRVDEMLQVGARALAVAVVGVVTPFVLGMGLGRWLLPEAGIPALLFLSATLCATSVGITARVLKDLGRVQGPEARIILGAAVIDDVLGLIILAVVVGIVATGEIQVLAIGQITLLSVAFLGAVILLGDRLVRAAVPLFRALDRQHSKLLFPLALAFLMAWLSNQIGLATIVGAFAAGLILNEEHFASHAEARTVAESFEPLESIFVPIFFVLMGLQVNLAAFLNPATLLFTGAFIVAAILGKLVAGLVAGKGIDRLSVGIGMIPRGEVGLIFASIGKTMGVVSAPIYAALVVVVMVTTLVTPPALKWSFGRRTTAEPGAG